jgi:hypothetical protein
MRRVDSDEAYVIDLCDEVVGIPASRQHRFDWLLGDPGKKGGRVRLPVDAFWESRALVVEYREIQHDRPVAHFDKPDRLTVSGVHRGLQRALYDARRDELIPTKGLRLVVIKPADLDADSRGRLRRNRAADSLAISALLASG